MNVKAILLSAMSLAATAGFADLAPGDYIYSVDCTGIGYGAIEGTQAGIDVNLPGSVWGAGGGWEWAQPTGNGNAITLNEEKANVYFPVHSTNDYVRPPLLCISADLYPYRDLTGLGFWPEATPRSKNYPLDDGSGGTELRRYNARTGFTGLLISTGFHDGQPDRYTKRIQLVVNGTLTGSAIPIVPSGNQYDNLSYIIDTTSGSLAYVALNGEQILGLPDTTAFTEAATRYGGIMSWEGCRTIFRSFSVSVGSIPSVVPILYTDYPSTNAYVGATFSVGVNAVNPNTLEALPVTLESFDGPANYTFADGVFSWSSVTTGVFTASFKTVLGDESAEKSVVFTIDPIVPVLTVERTEFAGYVGDPIAFGATALNPATLGAVPVTVNSFDGGSYAFSDGVFSWTPEATGTYTATFRAEIQSIAGLESATESATIRIFEHPKPEGSYTDIYRTDLTGVANGIKYAGTTWADSATGTDAGLVVNVPGAVWTWGSGFDWAIPATENGTYSLGNELACVLLPLAGTDGFTKPRKIKVEATFSYFSGNCLVGFWSENPYVATEGATRSVMTGFTGFRFNNFRKTLQLFANGVAQGESATISFLGQADGVTLSFVVDTQNGSVDYVNWDGFLAGEFNTSAFTDAATAYVGVGTAGNGDGGNARGSFSGFRVSQPIPGATVILMR